MSLDEQSEAYLKFLKHPNFISPKGANRLPFLCDMEDLDSFIQKGRKDFSQARKDLEQLWQGNPLGKEGFIQALKCIETRAYFLQLPEFVELATEMRTLILMLEDKTLGSIQKEALWEGLKELANLFQTLEECQRDQTSTYPLSFKLSRVIFELRKTFLAPIVPPPGIEKLEMIYTTS